MLLSLHLLVLTIEPVQTTLVLGQLLGTPTREPLLNLNFRQHWRIRARRLGRRQCRAIEFSPISTEPLPAVFR